MKKIIDGKLYDTGTADEILSLPSTEDVGAFDFEDTRLYRTTKGAFFLAGEGGARSRWGQQIEQNSWSGGSGVVVICEAKARELVEDHGTQADYKRLFGQPEQG